MTDEATVVLVHGLWMTGFEFLLLRRRLEGRHGFVTRRFNYQSVRREISHNAARLNQFVASIESSVVHLVGHSLGGLVVLQMLEEYPQQPPGRVVLLGSPVKGSAAARGVTNLPLGRIFLGRSQAAGLLSGFRSQGTSDRDIGVIAGQLPVGLGRLVGEVPLPHDGTVSVEETLWPGATDHVALTVSHTTMIFSRQVADQVAAFLEQGKFVHER